jgi:hypothetical protein
MPTDGASVDAGGGEVASSSSDTEAVVLSPGAAVSGTVVILSIIARAANSLAADSRKRLKPIG